MLGSQLPNFANCLCVNVSSVMLQMKMLLLLLLHTCILLPDNDDDVVAAAAAATAVDVSLCSLRANRFAFQ